MSMSKIKTIFQPFTAFQKSQDAREGGSVTLKAALQLNFSVTTWMLVGASVNALMVWLFTAGRYTLLISTVLLLMKFIRAFLQANNIMSNPYLQDVIPGRITALLPDQQTGEFSIGCDRKITVFHLGAKSNHPYGILAPQFKKIGSYLAKMNEAMDSGEVTGFLGQTTFTRMDSRGAPEFVFISYWNSIEDLWTFAHGSVHKAGWQWWEKEVKDNGYVGINHELFEADAQHWENIYANFQPTLMGATSHLVRDGKKIEAGVVDEKWLSPLIDARRGPLARSSGRMGRSITIHDEAKGERYEY